MRIFDSVETDMDLKHSHRNHENRRVAEIGNIHDFKDADKLPKWAILTPSVYPSANITRTGSITEQGSRQIKQILRIVWHLLVTNEMYVDDARRSKQIKIPKLLGIF